MRLTPSAAPTVLARLKLCPLTQIVARLAQSYHLAVLRGHNVDQPRNLAKSVTVE